MIEREVIEVDRAIQKLVSGVRVVGELDQDGGLIISECETLSEAVERKTKINELLSKKEALGKLLEEH